MEVLNSNSASINYTKIIDELSLKTDKELLITASIVRLILDERGVWYPSRESESVK